MELVVLLFHLYDYAGLQDDFATEEPLARDYDGVTYFQWAQQNRLRYIYLN